MDVYIDYLCDLMAFIKKNAQIPNTSIFNEGTTSGLKCVLALDTAAIGGPVRTGRDLAISLKVSAPINNWKQVLQAMGRLELCFINCKSEANELKVRYKLDLGAWTREENETSLIFENSLEARCIRLDTK